MFKFLITAAIIYFIYRYMSQPGKSLGDAARQEPLPKQEPEKRHAQEDYTDYEEIE